MVHEFLAAHCEKEGSRFAILSPLPPLKAHPFHFPLIFCRTHSKNVFFKNVFLKYLSHIDLRVIKIYNITPFSK